MQYFLLERALNYLIEQADINLTLLNGKTARFALDDLPLKVNFICSNDRIFLSSSADNAYDVDVKLKSSAFLALFQGKALTDLLRQDQIIIHGDVKTAQLLVDLLQQTDIDFEELLSYLTGDIAAHQAGKMVRGLQKSGHSLETLKDKIATFLIHPKRVI